MALFHNKNGVLFKNVPDFQAKFKGVMRFYPSFFYLDFQRIQIELPPNP